MASGGQVPVRESVGAALAFVRGNVRRIASTAALAALAVTVLTALALALPGLAVFTGALATAVRAFVYAAFVGAMLFGADAVRARVVRDGWRVWAAMAVVGFFMFIVMVVALLPGMIALFAGPMAPYVGELEQSAGDQAAIMQVMLRFIEEQPVAVLVFVFFYAAIWLLLTSRLYLAAPASVEHGRVLTFETWAWTKGETFRIAAARLMLLGPAWVLVSALDYVLGVALGVNTFDPTAANAAASVNPLGVLAYVFGSGFLTLAIFAALEAGLSTYLYKGLRPAGPTAAR